MNRKQSPKICFGVIPEERRNKLAVLKNAIREGSYKVKAEDIAEKILKEHQIEFALIIYNLKYQQSRDN
jgi:anti-sigma28 factor (negative regulator of flagellin synthesis)